MDIKNSNVVKKIEAKGKEIKEQVIGKEQPEKKVFNFEETEDQKNSQRDNEENASFKF